MPRSGLQRSAPVRRAWRHAPQLQVALVRGIAHHQRSCRSRGRRAALARSRGRRSAQQLTCRPSRQRSTRVARFAHRLHCAGVDQGHPGQLPMLRHHLRYAHRRGVGRAHHHCRARLGSAPGVLAIALLQIRHASRRHSPRQYLHRGVRRVLRRQPRHLLLDADQVDQREPRHAPQVPPRCHRVRVNGLRQHGQS